MDFLQYKQLHVHPVQRLAGAVTPPASKSSSTRAVLAASLAPGPSRIDNVANSHNVRAMIEACESLGAEVFQADGNNLLVTGPERLRDGVTINPGNSGIVLRLLMGATANLRSTTFNTPYLASLGQRSNIEMVDALGQLGVKVTSEEDGRLPITLDGSNVHAGEVTISGRRSSQFLSGLLYLGGLLDEPLSVTVTDELKARPMVHTTLKVLAQAGLEVKAEDDIMRYSVTPGNHFQPAHYEVGSDPASTAALLALAGAVDSEVVFEKYREEELGGVVEHLRATGVEITASGSTLKVRGGGTLVPRDFDGSLAPDAVLPLAALAAHADGTSRFYNIEHLRYKECDRISDFRRELEKAGVSAEERQDEIIIHGDSAGVKGGVEVDSHYDHGVILAMSLIALRSAEGLTINDPQYVAQTYPDFFDHLTQLGGRVTA
ncbi:3-phosphoshikimate 1-carboxyvinyltransferase [Kitasatospora sp. LaBMicrA B282]|uniref:3-phosphoshikimate 1-carboxyvinyltransferase n=1 Tax=Kitasatospora sp. LaBMicrA B282 TaxID=3420949 RepID=UPI003D099E4D